MSAIGNLMAFPVNDVIALNAGDFASILAARLLFPSVATASRCRGAINEHLARQGQPPLSALQETEIELIKTTFDALPNANARQDRILAILSLTQYMQNSQDYTGAGKLTVAEWDNAVGL